MTAIDNLFAICPAPHGTTPACDWAAVERTLGMPLPSDYKRLADAYGPGAFCGFLHLYHPLAPTEWVNLTGPMPGTIRNQLQRDRDRGTHPVPHAPQNLFPMGVTDNGNYLFWVTDPSSAPDRWHITINEARGPRWYTHDGGITDFLLAVLSGGESVPLFPRDILDQGVYFTPSAPSSPEPPGVQPTRALNSNEIRAWARAHGYEVPDRGRIPATIVDAWKQAQHR
ncbi:histone-like nucleoid-structuring protein Lsr2 [Streptomyces sp. NPDC047434]|uniref:Lsr2 family DNA-binding protein n=1 Tax=Streptomyces sp. NPDC047434 TaxID=3155143 RepID=UPI0033FCEDA1